MQWYQKQHPKNGKQSIADKYALTCIYIFKWRSCRNNTGSQFFRLTGMVMLRPHWVRCTTKGVHIASQTKATAIYALGKLRFSCPHRKDVRSHCEGLYTPSGVYQRKTSIDVIRYSHADWLKRFPEFLQGTYVLRWTCPHYRLAVYDAVHTVV